jgi:hypothetical protein
VCAEASAVLRGMEHMTTRCEQNVDLYYVETAGECSNSSDLRAEGWFSHCAESVAASPALQSTCIVQLISGC